MSISSLALTEIIFATPVSKESLTLTSLPLILPSICIVFIQQKSVTKYVPLSAISEVEMKWRKVSVRLSKLPGLAKICQWAGKRNLQSASKTQISKNCVNDLRNYIKLNQRAPIHEF